MNLNLFKVVSWVVCACGLLAGVVGCETAKPELVDHETRRAIAIESAALVSYCQFEMPVVREETSPEEAKPEEVKPPAKPVKAPVPTTYANAREGWDEGKPMVAILTAPAWCRYCRTLERELDGHIEAGVFDGVTLTIVNWDEKTEQARQLAQKHRPGLPCFVYYKKSDVGKNDFRIHEGYMDRAAIKRFVQGG